MKRISITALFITVFAGILSAQDTVTGYVFDDANRNGKKERKEKGIAQVGVSNGRDVVLTDEAGKYTLQANEGDVIFVIKPAGFQTPTDEYNCPKFYYSHKPGGSPEGLKYKGVPASGKLPKQLNFPLYAGHEEENFSFFVFGDPQVNRPEDFGYFQKAIVDEAKQTKGMSFGITLGDMVNNNLDSIACYKRIIRQMELPWYHTMGNHDMNMEKSKDLCTDSLSDETFEAHFGPANYAYNYGQVHFIHLDDILYPDPRDHKGYWGGLRNDQIEFVRNDLKHVPHDRLIVIAAHIPITNIAASSFLPESRNALLELLQPFEQVLILSAHTHVQYQLSLGKKEGLDRTVPIHEYNVGTTCGDWYCGALDERGIPVSMMRDGTPKGYAIIKIEGNRYLPTYKVAGTDWEHQININAPKVVSSTRASYRIYANFFMGSEGDKVEYRIDNGKWEKMTYTNEYDPTYYHYQQQWDYTDKLWAGRRPSAPVASKHLWFANLPVKNLPIGTHTIEVRAQDRYGRTYTESCTYRIEAVIPVR